jgi:flagellar transcriptional activator FlhD
MKMVNGSIAAIHEANLNFLISTKKLLAEDKAEAIKQFGITEETAEILECLSLLQVVHLAETTVLLSQVAFDDRIIGQVLANRKFRRQALCSTDTLETRTYFLG